MNIRKKINGMFGETPFDGVSFDELHHRSGVNEICFQLLKYGTKLRVDAFVDAVNKAEEICNRALISDEQLGVCFQVLGSSSIFSTRKVLTEIKNIGIDVPKTREIWRASATEDDVYFPEDLDESLFRHYIAFEVPKNSLKKLLWGPLAHDFGVIRPQLDCLVYIFGFQSKILIWPYNFECMSIISPVHEPLIELYNIYNQNIRTDCHTAIEIEQAIRLTLHSSGPPSAASEFKR